MPFKEPDLDFVGCWFFGFLLWVFFFFFLIVLSEVSYASPSEVFVTHLPSSVLPPRLMCSGRPTRTLLFPKMKSMSLKILVRLTEKLCEFCIITKTEKVGHFGSLFCLWKKKKKTMKRKCQMA